MTITKRWVPLACLVLSAFLGGCANRNPYGPYGYPQQYQAYPYGYGQPIQPSPSVGIPPPGMIPGQPMAPGSMQPSAMPGMQTMTPGAFAPGQQQVYPQGGNPMQPSGYFQQPANSNQPFLGW